MLQLLKRALVGATATLVLLATAIPGESETSPRTPFTRSPFVGAGAGLGAPSSSLPRMPPHHHALSAGSSTYTVTDIGAPSAKTYPQTYPIGFNNTGQFFGVGYNSSKNQRPDCIAYTTRRFVSGTGSQSILACSPAGMTDATTIGSGPPSVYIVGWIQTVYDEGETALALTLNPATAGVSYNALSTNSPSLFYGVNALGEAYGAYFDYPPIPAYTTFPPILYTVASRKAMLLQPPCGSPNSIQRCFEPLSQLNSSSNCPFGGCTINGSGLIIGQHNDFQDLTIFSPTAGIDQDLTGVPPASEMKGSVDLNNANQLLFSSNVSGTGYVAQIYDINAGTTTQIPPVANDPDTCSDYIPLSFSNTGEVLGYTATCSSGSSFYFTYDAVNGTQNLSNEFPILPAYSLIAPIGVNDVGQILVALTVASTGSVHWGTLNLNTVNSNGHHAQRKSRVYGPGHRAA